MNHCNSRKHLMILGAGPPQLSGIQKAVALGYEVTTVDYSPDNVGHRHSHHYVNCSTTDLEGVCDAARRLGVNGICTFSSDIAVPTIGYVCDELGLPGVSFEAARILTSKNKFREFLHAEGLSHPASIAGDRGAALVVGAKGLRFPVIVKPDDASGSRGVSRVDQPEADVLSEAIEYAKHHSRSSTVCIEEFLAGEEVGGDAYVMNGRIAFIAITHKHLDGFVVTGHSLPGSISRQDQQRVVQELACACARLGYRTGPLNFDVMVMADRVVILEMSARNGGNGIAAVIEHAMGIDVEQMTIRGAVDDLPAPFDGQVLPAPAAGIGVHVFGSPIAGTLQRISSLSELQAAVPDVLALFLAHRRGARVQPFRNNGNLLGYVLFRFPAGGYVDTVDRIRRVLRIRVDVDDKPPSSSFTRRSAAPA